MAIPTSALVWDDPMDPSDIVDYVVDFASILDTGEAIASFTVVAPSDSTLLGLTIPSTGAYVPVQTGTQIRIWVQIDAGQISNSAFSGTGATLPIEVTVTTNSVPPRKRQRTLVVKVVQR